MIDDEIVFLEKLSEQLRGYHCGVHTRLQKTIKNRIARIKRERGGE